MKELGLTLASLASAIKRIDPGLPASSGGLSQFFGTEDEIPEPSNTALMPALNQILGIAPPPVCQPDDEVEQILDLLRVRFSSMSPQERDMLRLQAGAILPTRSHSPK